MRFARLVMVVLVVAACGGPTSTPSRSPSPAPSASTCTICTAPPQPTATPSAQSARELPAPVAELEAGTYFKKGFEPRVTFTVDEGWSAAQATAGFFDIQDDPGSLDVVAVQFGNVVGADTAEDAAAAVAARPNVTVTEPEKASMGRYPGTHIVVETTDPLDTNPPVFHPVIKLTPGDVSIASGRRLDLTLLDIGSPGQVLAVMVGGSIAEWEHAMEIAAPVLESVRIGD